MIDIQGKKSIFTRITDLFLMLLWSVFLLYCGSGYQDILLAKYRAFLLVCGGYLLVMAVAAAESCLVGAAKPRSLRSLAKASSWPQRFALAYMVLTWVSALLSEYFPETIVGATRYEGALTITIYCICFLLVSAFGKPTKRLLWVIGSMTVLFCALCLVQMTGRNPFTLYPAGYDYFGADIDYAGAYLGTIGNVDLVAAYLCLAIPLFWVGLIRLNGRLRYLLAIPLVISLVVLLKMYVLAGLVGVAVGGVLLLPVVLPVSKTSKKRLALGILVMIVVGVIGVYVVDLGDGMLHEVHEVLHGNWDEKFGSGRIHIWKLVLQRIPQHIFFGAGPDTMVHAKMEAFSQFHDTVSAVVVAEIDVAHNEYLNILYHQGIFTLIAYLAMLVSLAVKWVRRSTSDPATAMLGGAALCYCVQAFFSFSMCITAPFFWVTLALLEARGRFNKEEENLCGKSS